MRFLGVVLGCLVACGGGGASSGGNASSQSTPYPSFGVVKISESFTGISKGLETGISAVFYQGTDCTLETLGPCTVRRCPQGSGAVDAIGPTVSAGAITISDGAAPPLTMAGPVVGSYGAGLPSPPYAAGDVLTVAASGGVVPAFSTTVVFPPPPVDNIQISGGTFTWTAGTSGSVLVDSLGSAPTDSDGATSNTNVLMECTFDASAGTGTIPALPDPGFTATGLYVNTATVQTVQAGDFAVTVIAEQLVVEAAPGR
jgi:hypothetical protein